MPSVNSSSGYQAANAQIGTLNTEQRLNSESISDDK
jgi:hypothetical protein